MDALKAFSKTLQLASDRDMDRTEYETPHTGYDHLCDMLSRAAVEGFDDAKLNRWLGYAQGVLVAYQVATLDELMEINRRCS